MRFGILGRAIVLGAILASPVAGYAQESTITGTVTDSTGAVLPGVTVVAVHEAPETSSRASPMGAAPTGFPSALARIG